MKGEGMTEKVSQNFTRAEAIQVLEKLRAEGDFEPHDRRHLAEMTDEELTAELIRSGHVQEEDFGGIEG